MTPEMTAWQQRYRMTDAGSWSGRGGGRFHEVVHVIDLSQGVPLAPKKQSPVALIGFACDEGIKRNQGRVGAAAGPAALRQALGKLAVHEDITLYDIGDVVCSDGNLEASQAALAAVVAKVIRYGMISIILGGGHELAWGHYQGLASALPTQRIGIINIDAHYDLRPLLEGNKGSSGTSFLQIAQHRHAIAQPFDYCCIGLQPFGNTKSLVATATELGVETVQADEIAEHASQAIDRMIERCDVVYLTLCLDVFATAYAPGVSAPQALGLTPAQVLPMIRQVAASGKLMGFDVAELSPCHDKDGATAALAAAMVATAIAHLQG